MHLRGARHLSNHFPPRIAAQEQSCRGMWLEASIIELLNPCDSVLSALPYHPEVVNGVVARAVLRRNDFPSDELQPSALL